MNWYKTIKISASQADIQALSILDNDNNVLEQIKSISPESKYTPIIAYFYKNNNINLNILKNDISDYKNFIDKKQLPLVDIRRDGAYLNNEKINYLQLQEMIHHQRDYKKYLEEQKQKVELSKDLVPMISKNNITVYESFSREKCINLGKGQTFCISNPQISQNMYQSYRDNRSSSFYFVFDKNKEDSDPLSLVVVDITRDMVLLTDKTNRTGNIKEFGKDIYKYFEYLESKGISREIFKHNPKTEEEKKEEEELRLERYHGLEWFENLSVDYKKKYIGRGHSLSYDQLEYLIRNKFDELVKFYLSLGHKLDDGEIDLFSDNREYLKTYLRARLLSQNNDYMSNFLSRKEYLLLDDRQKQDYYNDVLFPSIKDNNISLKVVPKEAMTPEICIEAVKQYGLCIYDIPKEVLLKYPEISLEAIKSDGGVIDYIPKEIRDKNPDIYIESLKSDANNFRHIPESLLSNDLLEKALDANPYIITMIEVEDKNLYLRAIMKEPDVLGNLPDKIMIKYPELCLEAVKRDGMCLDYVPYEVKMKYPEICVEAVKKNGICITSVPKNFLTYDLYKDAVKSNGLALHFVPDELRDEETCLIAVRGNGSALRSVPEKLRTKELCLEAVNSNPLSLYYVPEELKTKEFCIHVVKMDIDALPYVPYRVAKDSSFIEAIGKK